jgi:hypothetical protein
MESIYYLEETGLGEMEMSDTFLFVTCVNREELYAPCVRHIEQLEVPRGYTIEFLAVKDAKSMAEGYNRALDHEARYKIYLHQDTFILHKNFLVDSLYLFQSHPTLGMLGLAGCSGTPPSGNWGEGVLTGKWKVYSPEKKQYVDYNYREVTQPFEKVDLIDGFLMATQYDLPWREDIFHGFHLYDASQCMEFSKKGYMVGIPRQATHWAAHYLDHPINKAEWKKYQGVYTSHYGG